MTNSINFSSIQILFKKSVLALTLIAFFTFNASAQRIAIVDINQVLESMPEYRQAQKKLDDLAAKWRRQIAEQYDDIKGLYNKYQAEQVLLSDDMRIQKEEEITKKEKEVRDMQREKFGPEGSLFKERQEMVRPIQDRVYAAIEAYANDKGFDFILNKGGSSGLLFANERFDKTKDIQKELGVDE